MIHRAAAFLAVLLLLAGCVPPQGVKPPLPDSGSVSPAQETETLWRQHRAKMSGISRWRIKGRIAVKTGRKGGNATLLWAYRRDRQNIELYGPFGSGRVRIAAQPGRAVLKDTEGRSIEGASAAEALYERLGWRVPFQELRYWVRGIPDAAGGAANLTLDADGRLQTLQQGQWRVAYQEYGAVGLAGADLQLPRKLSITAVPGSMEIYDHDGEYIGDHLSVKVILKQWRDIEFAE